MPAALYGLPVESLYLSPDMQLISDAARGAPATPGCRTQRLTIDTRITDLRVPLAWGTGQELTLWSIRWEEAGAAAELPLTTGTLDGFDGLALDMAPFAGEMGPLLLVLEDTSCGCSAVRLPPLRPAAATAAYTTFTQVYAPLELLNGVDLSHVARLVLATEQPGPAQVLVSAVYVHR